MVSVGYEHVLIVGAETLSRIIDPEDRGTVVLFGDGAGAAVLTRTTGDAPALLAWDLGCDGSAAGDPRDPGRRQPPAGDGRDRRRARPLHEDARTRGVPARGARGRRFGDA